MQIGAGNRVWVQEDPGIVVSSLPWPISGGGRRWCEYDPQWILLASGMTVPVVMQFMVGADLDEVTPEINGDIRWKFHVRPTDLIGVATGHPDAGDCDGCDAGVWAEYTDPILGFGETVTFIADITQAGRNRFAEVYVPVRASAEDDEIFRAWCGLRQIGRPYFEGDEWQVQSMDFSEADAIGTIDEIVAASSGQGFSAQTLHWVRGGTWRGTK